MSVAMTDLPAPARWLGAPRLLAALALLALGATFFCATVVYILIRQADDRRDLEQHAALMGAIEDVRRSGADFSTLDPRYIEGVERIAGVKGLRFAAAPIGTNSRQIQSVLDTRGRIIGWFSWTPDHSITHAMGRLRPLLAFTGLCLIGFVGLAIWQVRRALRDLGESKRLAWSLAHEDALTGLANHRQIIEWIDAVLSSRAPNDAVTLAYLDIDALNEINDAFGHRIGDALLVAFATRLRDLMPPGAAAGRFGGDEFAVVTKGPELEFGAMESTLASLVSALARPYWIAGQVVQAGVTCGIAHAPRDGLSRNDLSRRAGLALRAAKRNRRGGVGQFDPAMEIEFDERRFIETELRRALDDGALDVHYQPIVSADGMHIVGAEALLRWTHPERGAIAPAIFVPVAERCGMMGQLGELVLRRAMADARRWPGLYVAVNLSPVQVRDPALVDMVAAMLTHHRLPGSRMMLEVTEGVLIDNPAEAKARLDALRALGVRLALDDFGTGYSSLSYLQKFKFDKLKIDKGFVEPLGRETSSNALVQAIVALGNALDATLLAEGVETEEQRVLLRLAGCQEMQGYLFARPASAATLDRMLAERTPRAAAVA